MTPENTVGYCAVICPKLDFWQAYFIVDTPELRDGAGQMKLYGLMAAPKANPFGALQATLVEGALEQNEAVVGAAALALRSDAVPYFYIMADRQMGGTLTSLHKIEASSPEEARDILNAMPEVEAMKKRLVGKMGSRDGQGRKPAFH